MVFIFSSRAKKRKRFEGNRAMIYALLRLAPNGRAEVLCTFLRSREAIAAKRDLCKATQRWYWVRKMEG